MSNPLDRLELAHYGSHPSDIRLFISHLTDKLYQHAKLTKQQDWSHVADKITDVVDDLFKSPYCNLSSEHEDGQTLDSDPYDIDSADGY